MQLEDGAMGWKSMVKSMEGWSEMAPAIPPPACLAAAEGGEERYEGVSDSFEVDFIHQYEFSNRTYIRHNTDEVPAECVHAKLP